MKKIMTFIAMVTLFFPPVAHGLSDSEYEILKENSVEFSNADISLGKAWKVAKSKLSDLEQKELLQDQRKWIKTGWDERAKELMLSQKLNRTKAYTQAIEERINFLNSYVPDASEKQSTQKTITVEAEGIGPTKIEALQAAWMEAVRKAVGMYITSKSVVTNDDIIEKIATYSKGQVNSYDILNEKKKDGLIKLTISAVIDRDIITDSVKSSKSTVVSFDGEDTAARNITSDIKKKSLDDLIIPDNALTKILEMVDYSTHLIKIEDNKEKKYILQHVLRFNVKKYMQYAKELIKTLDAVCQDKFSIPLNTETIKKSLDFLKVKDFGVNRRYINKFLPIRTGNKDPQYCVDAFFFPKYPHKNFTTCIVENATTAQCFLINAKNIQDILESRVYEFTFLAENANGGFDSNLAVNTATIQFPTHPRMISPSLNGGIVGVFNQELNLSNEDLMNVKKIIGRYEYKQRW